MSGLHNINFSVILPKSAAPSPDLQATGTAKRHVHKDKQTVRTIAGMRIVPLILPMYFICNSYPETASAETKLAVLLLGNPKIHGQYFHFSGLSTGL